MSVFSRIMHGRLWNQNKYDIEAMIGLQQIMRGSWKKVDLKPYDEFNKKLEAEFASKKLKITEGHTGSRTVQRQLYAATASLPGVSTICEIGFNAGQ